LNRCCAFAPDLESMLRDKMIKILLQQNPPMSRHRDTSHENQKHPFHAVGA
jgi:hypothetical protein